jgi:hypothetical protein
VSDDKLHDALTRAARAKELLNDPLLSEALASMEADYIAAWRATRPEQTDDRERLYIAVNQAGVFRDRLNAVVSNGSLAQAELNQLIEVAERKKKYG